MKPHIYLISLLFASMLSVNTVYAQQQDSLKQKMINFYSKVLTANTDTAKQVADIIDTYKQSAKKVIADATLSEGAIRIKFDSLIEEKNKKLERLLTPAQQAKVIPTTEREKKKTNK
jgi:hypothetical protein